MATNTNLIRIARSSVEGKVPTNLEYGELAINFKDEKLFFKNSSNEIKSFDANSAIFIKTEPETGVLSFPLMSQSQIETGKLSEVKSFTGVPTFNADTNTFDVENATISRLMGLSYIKMPAIVEHSYEVEKSVKLYNYCTSNGHVKVNDGVTVEVTPSATWEILS